VRERAFIDEVFGTEFYYYKGGVGATCTTTPKPNGVISRYPIIETGEWTPQYYYHSEPHYRPAYNDRNWTWAVVDVPGDRELLVVSVHLHTDKNNYEYYPLAEHIAAKQQEGNYYVAFGGDFNSKNSGDDRSDVKETAKLAELFYMKTGEYPVDQNGREQTNKKRGSILDWLLFSKDLEPYEIPLEIGLHTGNKAYPNGHVFDSRVYEEHGEISYVSPVEAGDSGAVNMQHMPVIRDIALPEN
jgi:endonuclease/exonuclease/phosphatase family metal-dependent hydrolase